jgi:ribosomal protein L37E
MDVYHVGREQYQLRKLLRSDGQLKVRAAGLCANTKRRNYPWLHGVSTQEGALDGPGEPADRILVLARKVQDCGYSRSARVRVHIWLS